MRIQVWIVCLATLLILLAAQWNVMGISFNSLDQQRPVADLNGNGIFDDLEVVMEQNPGPYPVILHLSEGLDSGVLENLQRYINGFSPTYIYRHLNAVALTITKDQILRLSQDSKVELIQWDAPVEIYMDTAAQGLGAGTGWKYGLTGDRDNSPGTFTPADVVIGMIDTGVDVGHSDLPPAKVIGWVDLVNGNQSPYDDHGHGTHVAGIAGGLGIGDSAYTGLAPGAGLVMVKALDESGKSRMSIVDAGIEWIIDQKEPLGIDILSISFGSSGSSNGSDSTSLLVNLAVTKGINVVTAAGNLGSAGQSIGSPGAADMAITVGAMSDSGEGGEFLAYFSSRGPTLDGRKKPDFCSPGWRIMAPLAGTADQYIVFSGTSLAAPFTAGMIAQILDLAPSLTPAQVKGLLLSTAEDWGPDGWDMDYGMGKVSLGSAIRTLSENKLVKVEDRYHFRGKDDLPDQGFYDAWMIDLYCSETPLAITMVTYLTEKEGNFDLYLYDSSGNLVAKGERSGRHEWISYQPTISGTYILEVVSYQGSGEYYLDLYGDILTYYLGEDNRL